MNHRNSLLFLFAALFLITDLRAQDHNFDPPWNTPPKSKVEFTVPGVDNVPDLFGDINNPQLVIFFAGNQFMCIDELIAAFKKSHPKYLRVFAETLPPGILAKQIINGSIVIGNMRITLKPDVYTAGKSRIDQMPQYFSKTERYAKNRLAIMVRQGNPLNIKGLIDLARHDVRVSMPNPEWEGICKRIEEAYLNVGGEALRTAVMETKVNNNTTFLTQIHHRQSPIRILYNQSDAAPVWYTEAFYQQLIGHPIELIENSGKGECSSRIYSGRIKKCPASYCRRRIHAVSVKSCSKKHIPKIRIYY